MISRLEAAENHHSNVIEKLVLRMTYLRKYFKMLNIKINKKFNSINNYWNQNKWRLINKILKILRKFIIKNLKRKLRKYCKKN